MKMENLMNLLLMSFALICLHQTCFAASFGQKMQRRKRSSSAVSPMGRLPDGTLYRDLQTCALVTCPHVDLSGCELKEVIIWKTGHNRFCRFCEYCLDWPWRAAAAKARRRRSAVPLLTSDDQLQQEVEDESSNEGERQKREISKELMNLFKMDQAVESHNRNRRSAGDEGKLSLLEADEVFNVLCPYVRCPVEPPNETCQQTEMLEGFIRGRQCLRCATCIDGTTVTSEDGQYLAPHWFQ